MAAFRELEASFEVGERLALPDLRAAPGVAAVRTDPPVELVATYLDTVAGDLVRAGITLRRRTGGSDAGWHLKVPATSPDGRDLAHTGPRDRTEHRVPEGSASDDATPPAELLDLVRARLHGHPVRPVAVVTTRRTVHHLLDPDGREVLEVADDEVRGVPTGDAARSWREWEVELRDGDAAQLDAAVRLLADAGGTAPRAVGKLVRTLGEVPTVRTSAADATAGEVARAYLATQVEALLTLDPAVRAGDDEAVHDARIATRRLRAVLSVCAPVFEEAGDGTAGEERTPDGSAPEGRAVDGAAPDGDALDGLALDRSAEAVGLLLRELGRLLGAVRDPAVEASAYRARAAAEQPGFDPRPALRLLVADRAAARRRALRAVRTFLTSSDGDALFAALTALADTPPTGRRAAEPARDLLRRRTRSRARDLAAAWASAATVSPGPDRDAALHEVRKRARHARYAAEVAALVHGRPARRSARSFQRVQDTLGEQHDTVVRRQTLERLAGRAGREAFVLGRWHAAEQLDAARAEAAGATAVRRALAARRTSWMA
ncbi:CYTH and CHAD domain-containing protein [Cellulomonas citrea]|uniref:CYTH and CHAD domain-containing protein n=1 Tax=Cellulomonas citrea TaxID=1909423 RepID=UPI0013585F51|nr:CYTH and CHAD domain-containing protein [Cellulomonas citrea]